ncbi:unnamed protein product [Cylicocyclus nassatus]|uniref:Uncharacterized protein n=1 Tax=Cylicocyclus nassatus TaxID=53992 RepID=A0AA36M7X4_CYLNA|nr:unnamed protein product [Cylicocyclus nassatus]
MKYLPGKLSPTHDPVMMYKQSEVQEMNMMNTKQGQWKTDQRHPGYLPAIVRNRLTTAWMRKYAKKKTENNCHEIEARFAVYIEEADRGQYQMYPATVSEQIRTLCLKWMLRTKRRDPQADYIKTKPGKELFCLLGQISQVINNTKVLRPRMRVVSSSCDCITGILEEYERLFTDNPFQACTLSQVGPHGNPKLMRYSLSPVDMAQIEARNTLSADEDQNSREPSSLSKEVDRFWMLSKEEKTLLRIKKQNEVVWEMAKQNSDFLAQSMAL